MSGKASNQVCSCGSGKKYDMCCGKPGPQGGHGPGWRLPGKYFQFHLSLCDAQPAVWRRFHLRADASFEDLHDAIQVLGWTNSHLWHFVDRRQREVIAGPPPYEAGGVASSPDACNVRLTTFFKKARDRCEYEYDFGDGWLHTVVLEEILDRPGDPYQRLLLDGEGVFPFEDCGGISGHQRLLTYWDTGVDPWDDVALLKEFGWDERPEPFDLAEHKELFDEDMDDQERFLTQSADQEGAGGPPAPIPIARRYRFEKPPEILDEKIMDAIGEILVDSMRRIGEELGLHADFKSAKYTQFSSTFTLEFSTVLEDGLVMNQCAETFLKRCEEFGLEVEDLGRSFTCGKETRRIVGLRPRAKAPVVCQRLDPPAPPHQLESWTIEELRKHLD